jgi:glycosyltransferase involved in cell wall biosynthesis
MGLPDNLQYLELVRRPLAEVAAEIPFTLCIASSRTWEDAPVPIEFVQWTLEAARAAMLRATVGLAPLTDDSWTRGKCVFRSIQYGGHGLPVIASPVGVTDQVVRHGETGFLARTEAEWAESLRRVLSDPALVERTGRRAHQWICERFSDDLALERWRAAIETATATATAR